MKETNRGWLSRCYPFMQGLKSPPAYPPAISYRSKDQKNNVDLKKRCENWQLRWKKLSVFQMRLKGVVKNFSQKCHFRRVCRMPKGSPDQSFALFVHHRRTFRGSNLRVVFHFNLLNGVKNASRATKLTSMPF